ECGWKAWKEQQRGGHHWAHYIIRWGSRELEKLAARGLIDRTQAKVAFFHSMRHTLNHHLGIRNVSEERRAALLGQQVSQAGENATRYLKLRHDPHFLSALIEEQLGDYVCALRRACNATSGC